MLTSEELKKQLIRHYLAAFCEMRNELPIIEISVLVENDQKRTTLARISESDIPSFKKEVRLNVNYSKVNGRRTEKTDCTETFNLKSFVIPGHALAKNEIKLVSKGEIAKDLKLDKLLPTDLIDGNRYLFLLSGEYIDMRDSDSRGNLKIVKRADFVKKNEDNNLFDEEEEILLEDVEDETNLTILNLHEEIRERCKAREVGIEELQRMFLLNPETIVSLKIGLNDTDDMILQKVYQADAKVIAEKDAEIKKQVESLDELDPKEADYQNKLMQKVNEFVKIIPLQNRTALTQYVARRKLILEQFDKILDREKNKVKGGARIDEKLLHNLIFQQSSDNPEYSDLWLIEEDFIYFKGFSETILKNIEIDGMQIFNKDFSEQEQSYLNSHGEIRLNKRPDILLFPEEGKCLIIEFKAPDVNVSEHLTQIDFYASLIRNYTISKIQITKFYGYLIGENIEDRDVRGRVSSFEHSYQFDYWFRPSQKVIGFEGRSDGSIYSEVIKFSTLLERAQKRNKLFINKLEQSKKIKTR